MVSLSISWASFSGLNTGWAGLSNSPIILPKTSSSDTTWRPGSRPARVWMKHGKGPVFFLRTGSIEGQTQEIRLLSHDVGHGFLLLTVPRRCVKIFARDRRIL